MLPKNLVQEREATPETFAELQELAETAFHTDHEQTTLEAIRLHPDGILQTPQGEFKVTQKFLESTARAIGMPLEYAYKISPKLFCENFQQRQPETTTPVTISRIGDVTTGMIVDHKSRYRPASTIDVLRWLREEEQLEFRRGSLSFAGMSVEFVKPALDVQPAVGDVVEIGLTVTNSECGGRQLKASASTFRLVCANGAVLGDEIGQARWPNDPRMNYAGSLLAFRRKLGELRESVAAVSDLYRASVERRVPDVELWGLWRRTHYLLPRDAADAVLGLSESERRQLQHVVRSRDPRELPLQTDFNAYDLHNRITHAAHGRPFMIRQSLQELGGDLISRAATWPIAPSGN
jgi:Domain of unknown function (DUF932)